MDVLLGEEMIDFKWLSSWRTGEDGRGPAAKKTPVNPQHVLTSFLTSLQGARLDCKGGCWQSDVHLICYSTDGNGAPDFVDAPIAGSSEVTGVASDVQTRS